MEIQCSAVKALFFREIRTRFGKYRLGYIWSVLEPSSHLVILITIFGYIMHRTMPDISYPACLLHGVIPYFIFSSVATRSVNAIDANRGLFNYRPVRPIDTLLARTLLETIIYIIVYALLMLILAFLGENFSMSKLVLLFTTWLLLIIFSLGTGLIFMVLGQLSPEAEKILPIIIKPVYFISCVMFPIHAVPKEYWHYLLWNPVVHIVELSREAVVPGYVSEGVSLGFLAISSVLILFIGLALYRTYEEKMLTS